MIQNQGEKKSVFLSICFYLERNNQRRDDEAVLGAVRTQVRQNRYKRTLLELRVQGRIRGQTASEGAALPVTVTRARTWLQVLPDHLLPVQGH